MSAHAQTTYLLRRDQVNVLKYVSYSFLVVLLLAFNPVFADELVVPVMVGQTGASANFGKGEIDAYRLAVEEWNARGGVRGKKVSLKIEDTQTNQKQILTAFQHLALDNPPVIVGPTWLDGFQAIIPVARRKNILLVTPSAAQEAFSKENADWPVTFYHNSTLETKVLLDGLKKRGYKRFGIIYEQEPFAEMIRNLALKNLPDPLADIGVQAGDADFRAVLTKLRTKKPDALLVFVWNEQSLLSLLQQVRTLMPDVALATCHDGEGWLNNPTFKSALPQLTFSKFLVVDSSFEKRFEKRFGYKPMLTASNAYDAMNAVLSARAADKNSAQDIRDYLTSEELNTVTFGKFHFEADGNVPSKVVVIDRESELG